MLGLKARALTLWVCCHHKISLQGIVPHLHDCYPESIDNSLNVKTPILTILISVSITRLKSWKSWYQSQYQDCNLKFLDTSLDIKTGIIKVFISRLFFKSLETSFNIRTRFSKVLISISIVKTSLPLHCDRHQTDRHLDQLLKIWLFLSVQDNFFFHRIWFEHFWLHYLYY